MSNASFAGRLQRAAEAQSYVARLLNQKGFYTLLGPIGVSSSFEEFEKYRQSCDIECYVHHPNISKEYTPVEVKSGRLKFTGAYDYPYDRVLVCSTNAGDDKQNMVVSRFMRKAFVFVSDTGIACLPFMTKVVKGEAFDGSRGHRYQAWWSQKSDLVEFEDFVKRLKSPPEHL